MPVTVAALVLFETTTKLLNCSILNYLVYYTQYLCSICHILFWHYDCFDLINIDYNLSNIYLPYVELYFIHS